MCALSGLGGCASGEKDLLALPFGKLYDETLDVDEEYDVSLHLINIAHSSLTSMTDAKESFLLLVYDRDSDCVCYESFQSTLQKYLKKTNALIYGISPSEFDGGAETYGLHVSSSAMTFAIFENGTLYESKYIDGTDDEFILYENFSSWLKERVHHSDMLYVTLSQLPSLFEESECPFVLGFLRNSCSSCSYLSHNYLASFNTEEHDKSYVIDLDVEGIRLDENGEYDEKTYAAFKERMGLSSLTNADYGYQEGYVPAFYRYEAKTDYEKAYVGVMDAAIYGNDQVKNVDGEFQIVSSYYDGERPCEYWEDLEEGQSNLIGKTLSEEEVLILPCADDEGFYYWRDEEAAKTHEPLLSAFLTKYLGD